ncbi:hypothetical protein DUNSADRAFT_5073 [Dunaliella salina]|uniref:Encoded protein n=1 Tax=Dunaliella salina TaxID=3046 RepID=A0ABQ7HAF3_DUNSA|nr:hypothetical protein DUNSADRAFT_5073 [Dunaliella salina]|eukprot:KAF5843836.1 hypothetical protein DUNSADRAFT_5073 [Dunaliella salina]
MASAPCDLNITGVKPGTQTANPGGNAKLAIGERMSLCGKFAINAGGHWRELPSAEQMQKEHEMGGVGHDGKPLNSSKS